MSGAARELTVASFNVHVGRGLRWLGYRPFDVVEAFRRLDADLVAMQESWNPDDGEAQHDAVARELGYHVVAHPLARATLEPRPHVVAKLNVGDDAAAADEGTGTWGIAVLSRVPFESTEVVPFPQLRFDKASRAVLRTRVCIDGVPLWFCGTHLAHLERGSPLMTRALRAALPPADAPGVLMGDMNMWSPIISAMAPPGWRRHGRGRTFPSPYPHSRIDHLLTTRSVEVVASEVVADTSSDHRPIRARLRLHTR